MSVKMKKWQQLCYAKPTAPEFESSSIHTWEQGYYFQGKSSGNVKLSLKCQHTHAGNKERNKGGQK
jgi:hypothetical protein